MRREKAVVLRVGGAVRGSSVACGAIGVEREGRRGQWRGRGEEWGERGWWVGGCGWGARGGGVLGGGGGLGSEIFGGGRGGDG